PVDSLHFETGVTTAEIATVASFLSRTKLVPGGEPVQQQLSRAGVHHISLGRLVPLDTRWRTRQWPDRPEHALDPDYEESLSLAQQAFDRLSDDRTLDIRAVGDLVRLSVYRVFALVALEHHRTVLGSGYPDIGDGVVPHVLSQIVSVADIYEAVTGARSYQAPTPPDRACLLLARLAGTKLNSSLVKAFVNAITFFPVGSLVRTSRGELAIVVRTTPHDPL